MSMAVVASVVGGMVARSGLAPRPVGGPHMVAEGVAFDYTLSPNVIAAILAAWLFWKAVARCRTPISTAA
jgi:hypothetical protein